MSRRETGLLAEDAAARLFAARGARIVARNLRTPYAEIDLLAEEDGTLVLVEVKARARNAAYALSRAQRQRLVRAALYLQGQRGSLDTPIRFDVVTCDVQSGAYQHIIGAWDASD